MAVLPSKARPALMRAASQAGDDYGVTAQPSWREINWREHLRSMEIDGGNVNYVDMGSGDAPPVLFVHGLGGCWQNWLENVPRVAQERRVIAPDLPGFGASEMPLERISIPGYGQFLDKLCDRLGLDEVVIVGNSMGGFVGAEVAIQFPSRVERLVLVSAAAPCRPGAAPSPRLAPTGPPTCGPPSSARACGTSRSATWPAIRRAFVPTSAGRSCPAPAAPAS
jgi:pimeloyl-ACP methyl ester carboxylesterase